MNFKGIDADEAESVNRKNYGDLLHAATASLTKKEINGDATTVAIRIDNHRCEVYKQRCYSDLASTQASLLINPDISWPLTLSVETNMREAFFKRMRAISVVLFLLGLVTAILAYSVNRAKKPKPPIALTMISQQTLTPTGEPVVQGFTKVRYQRADGSWKQVSTLTRDGKVAKEEIVFGLTGRGVFQVDEQHRVLQFLSAMTASPLYVSSDLRRDEHYVKDDSILGYETRVLRFNADDGSGYTENYYAPGLQDLLIKTVSVSEKGVSVTEATQIRLGEPSEGEFRSLPDWPIRFERFEEKIESMEGAGNQQAAEQMRQLLNQERLKHPYR